MIPRSPHELVAIARECHARGDKPRTLLRTCYGVAFPEETFVLLECSDELTGSNVLPWSLVQPDLAPADSWLEMWTRVYEHDPMLVPLDHAFDEVVCYRLDELAAGRSTIFAVEDRRHVFLGPPHRTGDLTAPERIADSFLALRHERAAAALRSAIAEWNSPANRGAGSIDEGEVEWRRSEAAEAEELLRELARRLEAARTV